MIPAAAIGDNVCYYLQATDTCANIATTTLRCFTVEIPLTPPYSDDFESATQLWFNVLDPFGSPGTNWEHGTPAFGTTTGAHSGTNAWDINLTSAYTANALTVSAAGAEIFCGPERIAIAGGTTSHGAAFT